jgi:tetratricopeptide (TPR) repeat protein
VSLDLFTGAGAGGRFALDEVQRAVPILEAARDDAGLARAWRLAMQTEIMLGRLDDASVAAGRVVDHATRAADRRLASRSATSIAYINVHGPLPVAEAIARCEELLASVQGDRKVEAVILSSLAQLRAMDGDFETARELYRRGQAILAELGAGIDLHSTSIDSSQVERLAGDLAAAEAELRRDYSALDELGESYFRSTIAAFLAQVLWSAGKLEDADSFARIAEQIADPEDILSQVPWRGVRAKLIAARGDAAEARAVADGAVAMAGDTGDLALQAGAVTDLADVLELLGRGDEAGRLFEQALELYQRKGDRVSAARIAGRLAVIAG